MSNESAIALMLTVSILLAGCGAITGSTPADRSQHRFVVENGHVEAQNITVTINTDGDRTVVNETRHVMAGEQWVITTLNVSVLKNGYTMTVLARGNEVRNEASQASSGATLVVVGGGQVLTCGGNLTCYNETYRTKRISDEMDSQQTGLSDKPSVHPSEMIILPSLIRGDPSSLLPPRRVVVQTKSKQNITNGIFQIDPVAISTDAVDSGPGHSKHQPPHPCLNAM